MSDLIDLTTDQITELALTLGGPPGKYYIGACEHRVLVSAPSPLAAAVYYGHEIAPFIWGIGLFTSHVFKQNGKDYSGYQPWEKFICSFEQFCERYESQIPKIIELLKIQLDEVKFIREDIIWVDVESGVLP